MALNVIIFIVIQVGLLLVVSFMPEEIAPVTQWPAIGLTLWIAISVTILVKIWRTEVVRSPIGAWLFILILPVFITIHIILVIAELISESRLLLRILSILAFSCVPLSIIGLLHRMENSYNVDLFTVPNYVRLTGLLMLCLLLVYGGWFWAGNWNNGIKDFAGDERIYAEAAFKDFEYCVDWSGGLERLRAISRGRFIRRVVDIETLPHYRYSAKVQFYTWMRIPTHSVTFRGTVGEKVCPL